MKAVSAVMRKARGPQTPAPLPCTESPAHLRAPGSKFYSAETLTAVGTYNGGRSISLRQRAESSRRPSAPSAVDWLIDARAGGAEPGSQALEAPPELALIGFLDCAAGSTMIFNNVEKAAVEACCSRAMDWENAARRAARYPLPLKRLRWRGRLLLRPAILADALRLHRQTERHGGPTRPGGRDPLVMRVREAAFEVRLQPDRAGRYVP
jgi:hypothetical protein